MSFGFSVGDFLAVGKLIADITSCLKDVGGSKSEYRDLIVELECLQKALVHLDQLKPQDDTRCTDSIKYAALSCRRPLEEFLAKLKRYEPLLGPRAIGSSWKAPVDKVRFLISEKDEIRKMQSYLSVHVGTLNVLLAEYGLERMNITREQTQSQQLEIKDRLETTKGVLLQVRDSVTKQAAAIHSAASILGKLYKLVSGEIWTSLSTLESMVASVCVFTQQTYSVVVEIRGAVLSRPDIRWTFLQDPVLVEDALGRKFPVPSEYDFALLDRIIQHKFETGPGSVQVSHGDYQIRDSKERQVVLSWQSHLRPGSSLIMAVLARKPPPGIQCPMPRCSSAKTTQAEGGGRLCCSCGVWFSETEQKRRSLLDLWEASRSSNLTPNFPTTPGTSPGSPKRASDDDIHTISRKRRRMAADKEARFKYISLAESGSVSSRESSVPAPSADAPQSNVKRIPPEWRRKLREVAEYLDSVKDGFPHEFDPQGSLSGMIARSLDTQHSLETSTTTLFGLITLFVELTKNAWDDCLAATLGELKRLCGDMYHIDLDARTVQRVTFDNALAYVNDIKATFNSTRKPEYYRKFLDILEDAQANKAGFDEAAPRIFGLIESSDASRQDQKRLMSHFGAFLPEGWIIDFSSERIVTAEGKFVEWQGWIQDEWSQ